MKVAVVIPLFNGERWIAQTLRSVLAQTRPADEIVVVDDGSEDRSADIVRQFPQVTLLRSPVPAQRMGRDHGAAHCQAPLIAFLDQDDVWSPGHLERMTQILEGRPGCVAVAAGSLPFTDEHTLFFEDDDTARVRLLDVWGNYPFGTIATPSIVLMRRSNFERTGGWLAQTEMVNDVELWLKMAQQGEFLLSEPITVGRRVHSGSLSSHWRSKALTAYLKALKRCAKKAGALRLEQHPEQEKWVKRRIGIAATMCRIGQSFSKRRSSDMVEALHQMRRQMERELSGFQNLAWANLIWFLGPTARGWRRRGMVVRAYLATKEQIPTLAPFLETEMGQWSLCYFAFYWLSHPSWKRWGLFRSAMSRKALKPPPAIVSKGRDADGWIKKDCAIRILFMPGFVGVRIGLEFPGWSGLPHNCLTLSGTNLPPICATVCPGDHEILIPFRNGRSLMEIQLQCEAEFELPNDGRRRSMRVSSLVYLKEISSTEAVIRHSNPSSAVAA